MAENNIQPTADTRRGGLRLGISWKLTLPFVLIIVVMLGVMLPFTNRTIENILEAETDNRLVQTANAFGELLEQTETPISIGGEFCGKLARC